MLRPILLALLLAVAGCHAPTAPTLPPEAPALLVRSECHGTNFFQILLDGEQYPRAGILWAMDSGTTLRIPVTAGRHVVEHIVWTAQMAVVSQGFDTVEVRSPLPLPIHC